MLQLPTMATPPATSQVVPAGAGPAAPQAAGNGLPSLAAILAKRASGQPLSNAEKGRLSWYGRQSGAPSKPAGPAPAPRRPALAGLPSPAEPFDPLPAAPDDPELVKTCCGSALDLVAALEQTFVSWLAVRQGFSPKEADSFAAQCEAPPALRQGIIDLSPAAAAQAGFSVAQYPLYAFGAALLAFLTRSLVAPCRAVIRAGAERKQAAQRAEPKA